MKIRALLIEDEQPARVTIRSYLMRYFPQIEVIDEIDSVAEGERAVRRDNFDFIFLDIQLTDGNGISILESLEQMSLRVIFTTAFDDYTIQAFKHKAFGYLLKPINPLDFKEIVGRVIKDIKLSSISPSRIRIPLKSGFKLIDSDTIVRCQADSNYSKLICKDGKSYTLSKTLKAMEKELSPEIGFVRIHQSHIVNIGYIDMQCVSSTHILLENGEELAVSRKRREQLWEVMNWTK